MGIPKALTVKQDGSIPWSFEGSNHLTQPVFKQGIPVDSAEDNEGHEIGKYERMEAVRSVITDGVILGDVWDDGGSHDSFKVTYNAGVLTVAAGRAIVGKRRVDLGLGLTADLDLNSSTPASSLTGYTLPAIGNEHVFYIRIYERSIPGTVYFVPAGNSANRSKYFDMLLDVQYYNSAVPGDPFSPPNTPDINSQAFLEIGRVSSTGVVTDKRLQAKLRNVFTPGQADYDLLTIASGLITATKPNHKVEVESGSADTLTNINSINFNSANRLAIRANTTGNVVTLQHAAGGAGQLFLIGSINVALDTDTKVIEFEKRGTDWYEVSRNFGDVRDFGRNADTVLTIVAGEVTPTQPNHAIDTSGGPATLNNILLTGGMTDGEILILRANNAGANPVTIAHAAGGDGQVLLYDGGNFVLDVATKIITLKRIGTTWYEVSRSNRASTGWLIVTATGDGSWIPPEGVFRATSKKWPGGGGGGGGGSSADTLFDGFDGVAGTVGEDTWFKDNTKKARGGLAGQPGVRGIVGIPGPGGAAIVKVAPIVSSDGYQSGSFAGLAGSTSPGTTGGAGSGPTSAPPPYISALTGGVGGDNSPSPGSQGDASINGTGQGGTGGGGGGGAGGGGGGGSHGGNGEYAEHTHTVVPGVAENYHVGAGGPGGNGGAPNGGGSRAGAAGRTGGNGALIITW